MPSSRLNRIEIRAPLAPNARLRYEALKPFIDSLADACTFVEIGAGQGALATILARRFEYVGYEPDEVSCSIGKARLAGIGRGVIHNDVLPEHPYMTFDIVGAFEVLEHIDDDFGTIESWSKWVKPGGHMLLTVPAHPERFGPGDVYAGHFRRYTRDRLVHVLTSAGFDDIQVHSSGFPLGYALEAARHRVLGRRLGSHGGTRPERTAASGRTLQVDATFAPAIWAGTLPFRWIQRRFDGTNRGTNYAVSAHKPRS